MDLESLHVVDNLSQLPDNAIIELIKQKKNVAYEEIYRRYKDKIYDYVYRRVSDTQLADDLSSKVFVKMIEALNNGFVVSESFSGWIYRVAHNLIIDYYRERDRRSNKTTPLTDCDGPRTPVDSSDLLDLISNQIDAAHIWKAVEQLPTQQREIVKLRFLEERSIKEVAIKLGKSEEAVKALTYRAMNNLRALLKVYFTDHNATALPRYLIEEKQLRKERKLRKNANQRDKSRQRAAAAE